MAALVVGIILGVGGGACLAASIGVFTGRRGSATDGLPLFFGGLTGAGIGLPFAIYGGTSVPASAARRGAPGEMGWAWRF